MLLYLTNTSYQKRGSQQREPDRFFKLRSIPKFESSGSISSTPSSDSHRQFSISNLRRVCAKSFAHSFHLRSDSPWVAPYSIWICDPLYCMPPGPKLHFNPLIPASSLVYRVYWFNKRKRGAIMATLSDRAIID